MINKQGEVLSIEETTKLQIANDKNLPEQVRKAFEIQLVEAAANSLAKLLGYESTI